MTESASRDAAIERLLDLEQIRQLPPQFTTRIDRCEANRLAELFTEDGEAVMGPYGSMTGRPAIEKGFNWGVKHLTALDEIHAITNPVLSADGDTGEGNWYLIAYNLAESTTSPLRTLGRYDCEFRKVDGKWYFSKLTMNFLWTINHGKVTAENPLKRPGR